MYKSYICENNNFYVIITNSSSLVNFLFVVLIKYLCGSNKHIFVTVTHCLLKFIICQCNKKMFCYTSQQFFSVKLTNSLLQCCKMDITAYACTRFCNNKCLCPVKHLLQSEDKESEKFFLKYFFTYM